MKTTSAKITKENAGWQKASDLFNVTFEKDITYTLQVKGSGLNISLNTETPADDSYFYIGDMEKFNWTYDGTNELWIKSDIPYRTLILIIS